MAEMFGAPIGISQGIRDSDSMVGNALKAIQTLGEIDKQPLEKEILGQHAKLYGAQAEEHLLKNEQQRRFNDALARMGTGDASEAKDPLALLRTVGGLKLQAGQTAEARQIFNTVSNIETREVTQTMLDARRKSYDSLVQKRQVDRVASLGKEMLRSPEDYRRGLLIGQSEGLDMSMFPADYEAGKPLVTQLVGASVSKAKELELEARAAEAAGRERARNAQISTAEENARIRRAELKIKEDAEARRARAAGGLRTARPEERKEAANFIRQQFKDANVDAGELDDASGQLANDALALMRSHPGIQSYSQALAQVFQKGDWEDTSGVLSMKPKMARRTGNRPDRAYASVPMKEGKPDEKALKVDSWYTVPGKGVFKYKGNGKWEGAPMGSGGAGGDASSGEGSAGEADDDEDED